MLVKVRGKQGDTLAAVKSLVRGLVYKYVLRTLCVFSCVVKSMQDKIATWR